MLKSDNQLSKHYYFVDFFRGVAAVAVLIGHYQHFFYVKGRYSKVIFDIQPFYTSLHFFYHNGAMAVKLFWVISGFVFASAYLMAEIPSAKSFFLKRFARLYPLHLLTLCIVALLQLVSVYTTKHFQIYQFNDPYHFLLNLGFVSNWGFQSGYSFNAPIWSVSVEIFVYILFYCSLWFLKRAPILCTMGLVLAFNLLVEKGNVLFPFKFCAIYFYLGVGTFILMQLTNKWNLTVLAIAAGAVVITAICRELYPNFGGYHTSLFIMLPAFVLFLCRLDALDSWEWGKKLKMLGDLSFSIYLCHVPIEIVIMIVTEYYGVSKQLFESEIFFVSYIAFVLAISYCSYFYFELPMRNYFRQKTLQS